ncbi:MAG TPA: hypothetical protein VIM30_14800 [Candidatus Limnocylindrales bacterium]|jgi:hypothetical protein
MVPLAVALHIMLRPHAPTLSALATVIGIGPIVAIALPPIFDWLPGSSPRSARRR